MKLVTISLVLLSLVSLSGIASLAFRIPLPLLQVAFGIVLFTLFRIHIAIEPSLFLLLFIAPLLYVDAYQFPRAEFFRLRRSILVMSVGLVILTVLGVGYFVHWMIPTVPLSVCFALAAVLSPTDAVAVTGSLRGEAIPARLLYLLRGEALFNDASGLVCFRLAIAATLTGSFSVAAASLTFLIVSVGGLAVGTLLSYIVMRFQIWMEKSTRSHSTAQILLTLLLPFAAYASAEYLKVSGVLAAVGAGFVGKWVLKDIRAIETRLQGEAIMGMMQFSLEGLVFVLLGIQLPPIIQSIPSVITQEGFRTAWVFAEFIFGVTAFLLLLRFVWTWSALQLTLYSGQRNVLTYKGTETTRAPARTLMAMSLAGVRGAVTLAAVSSIPATLNKGTLFPARDLCIVIAAGVVLLSLLLASIALPPMMKGIEVLPESAIEIQERAAHISANRAAIQRVDELQEQMAQGRNHQSDSIGAVAAVINSYQQRLAGFESTGTERAQLKALHSTEQMLRLEAVRAERTEINRLIREHRLEQSSARRMLRRIDNTEAAIQSSLSDQRS